MISALPRSREVGEMPGRAEGRAKGGPLLR